MAVVMHVSAIKIYKTRPRAIEISPAKRWIAFLLLFCYFYRKIMIFEKINIKYICFHIEFAPGWVGDIPECV